MQGFLEGRLSARRDWAPGLVTLTIEADIEPFQPGQFVNLALEVAGEWVRRPYSIASPPGRPPEFFLTQVSLGALTPALFALAPGDRLWIEPRAAGHFTLAKVQSARDLWLVATGTGLGPFLAMLGVEEPWQRFEHVVLVHGVREAAHLAYRDELAALARQRAGRFTSLAAVSRERIDGALHGRITTALTSGELERASGRGITAETSQVLLCGNPAMIEEFGGLLAARGLTRNRASKPGQITVERYW